MVHKLCSKDISRRLLFYLEFIKRLGKRDLTETRCNIHTSPGEWNILRRLVSEIDITK